MTQVDIQTKEITTTNQVVKIEIDDIQVTLDDSAKVVVRLLNDSDNLVNIEIVDVTGDEYNAWGTDDSYIIDLVLTKLGMTKA